MLSIPKQIQSKLLIYKFFYIFEDNLKLQSTLFLKNLDKIITKQKKIENVITNIIKDEFFYVFNSNFSKIENYLKKENNYQILHNFLISMKK